MSPLSAEIERLSARAAPPPPERSRSTIPASTAAPSEPGDGVAERAVAPLLARLALLCLDADLAQSLLLRLAVGHQAACRRSERPAGRLGDCAPSVPRPRRGRTRARRRAARARAATRGSSSPRPGASSRISSASMPESLNGCRGSPGWPMISARLRDRSPLLGVGRGLTQQQALEHRQRGARALAHPVEPDVDAGSGCAGSARSAAEPTSKTGRPKRRREHHRREDRRRPPPARCRGPASR